MDRDKIKPVVVFGILFALLGVVMASDITSSIINNYYNNTTVNESAINHNNLSGLQGGFSTERYHVTSQMNTLLTPVSVCSDFAPSTTYYKYLYDNDAAGRLTCGFIPYDNLSWATQKVNKSGDLMTGTLYINTTNATNYSLAIIGNKNDSAIPFIVRSNYTGYETQYVRVNTYGSVDMVGINASDNGLFTASMVGDTKARILFGLNSGKGYLSFGSGSASRDVHLQRSAANMLLISSDGSTGKANVTITGLSGTGNAYACINSAGKLYRSATVCV